MCTYTERSPCRGDFVLSRVNKLLHDPITDSSLYNGWLSAEYELGKGEKSIQTNVESINKSFTIYAKHLPPFAPQLPEPLLW